MEDKYSNSSIPADVPRWLMFLPTALRRRIECRQNLIKAISNTGWLFGDHVLRMTVGLVVGIWIARYLGPQQFGIISYAIAFVSLFSVFSSLGMNSIVVRDLVRDRTKSNEILGSAFALQFSGSIVAFIATLLTVSWIRPDDATTKLVVAIVGMTLTFKAADVIRYWFESIVQSRYVVVVDNGVFLMAASLRVVLILSGAPMMAFVWIVFAEAVLVFVGLLYVYAWRGRVISAWRARREQMKRLIRESWSLIVSGFAIIVYMRIDQIMIGEIINDESVGVYSVAVRISEVANFLPVIIVSSVFPSIVHSKNLGSELYFSRMKNLYAVMLALALLFAIPISFMSPLLIKVLFGSAYEGAARPLSLLAWACIPVCLGVAWSRWLVVEGKQHVAIFSHVAGMLINVALNIFLIPAMGVSGAAIATVVSYFLSSLMAFSLYKAKFTYSAILQLPVRVQ